MMLKREEILKRGLRKEPVCIDELGGEVYIRRLSGNELSLLMKERDKGDVEFAHHLLSIVVCDESGKSMFSREEIGNLDAKVIQQLIEPAMRISALSAESRETIAKNSQTPANASGSN